TVPPPTKINTLSLHDALPISTGKSTIVVLINGRPMSINWIDRFVPGIIEAWFPGAQGGTAIADVLFGDYNPGGKLSVTFPKTVGDRKSTRLNSSHVAISYAVF